MKKWIFLLGICIPSVLWSQHMSIKNNRIYLGDNTLIYGSRELNRFLTDNLEYNEQSGYSGDYDEQTFKTYPFGLKIVAAGTRGRQNHIENQDKNILIWITFRISPSNKDYLDMERSDFEYKAGKERINIRDYVTYMPDEYSKNHFNADTTLTFSFDMEGKKINDIYGHHKAILMYKRDASFSIRLDCFLTDKGLKDFDSKYLKDIEKMFRFKNEEETEHNNE